MPGEIVVAPHGRCCCVISSEPGVDSAMLKLDRQKRLKLVEARELPWRFTQAYAASNTALMLARIEGGSLHVARIDGRRKLVTATCQKLDDDSLSIAGGPSVNRLGFATTDGTTIFDF
ncbi:MAG TPA: hypothetical protein VGE52_15035, partial [Pirellulales bacterium]